MLVSTEGVTSDFGSVIVTARMSRSKENERPELSWRSDFVLTISRDSGPVRSLDD